MTTRGRLLIATPALHDPNFELSVIYVLEHGDEGALGVALNHPSELPVAGTFENWVRFAAPPDSVFVGGPVSPSSVIALARVADPTDSPAWNAVVDDLGTVDLDADPEGIAELQQVRMFAGYAGWEAGQLDAELAEDAWFVVDAEPGDVHTAAPDQLWWSVMARQPEDRLRMLRHYPTEPWLN